MRVAEFDTLTAGLDYAAKADSGFNFFSTRGVLDCALSYRELRERSIDVALRLSGSGLERGSKIGLIAETSPDFMAFFFGCQYAGMVPVPLPLNINIGGHEAYVSRLRGMIATAQLTAVVSSDDYIQILREAALGSAVKVVATVQEFMGLPTAGGDLQPLGKDDPCYVQYSSGSTSMPRGVLITQRAITSNARGIGQSGLELRTGDRAASWLPLYHDMGLVGFCLTPMLSQVSVDYIATTSFARRPLLWLKLISEMGGTIAFSPTFGYDLCVRRATAGQGDEYQLGQWRVAGIGGEMVRPEVLQQFADQFAGSGFDAKAFLPSYGLAESTLAVSFGPLNTGVRVDHIERKAYEQSGQALSVRCNDESAEHEARPFVICGGALPDHELEIRDELGRALPERLIGRICVKGPSVMEGYFHNQEATSAILSKDGWMDTGDLGYLVNGELVVTGRSKDLIICNGRNIWPQDLEWTVEKLPGIKAGCVAAFAVEQEDEAEQVVIVAETRLTQGHAQRDLVREILYSIRRSAGVECQAILVPPRSLKFTSSGKLSRAAVRDDFLAGTLQPLDIDEAAVAFEEGEERLAAAAS